MDCYCSYTVVIRKLWNAHLKKIRIKIVRRRIYGNFIDRSSIRQSGETRKFSSLKKSLSYSI